MRVWLTTRTTGEPDWVESSCGTDVGITQLKVGRVVKPITLTAATYLPPYVLRIHRELMGYLGLTPGAHPGACIENRRITLGPLVGVMASNRDEILLGGQVRKLLAANTSIGCLLCFFTPEDICREDKRIACLTFFPLSGWESRDMPLPDVIYEQTAKCPNELRQYLLGAGTKPVNLSVAQNAASILSHVRELNDCRIPCRTTRSVTVLMQRDELGQWNATCRPDEHQKLELLSFCHRAVIELEKSMGCLGELEFALTIAETGRVYVRAVTLIPDKRLMDEDAFELPLLFSRRLAGFPAPAGA